MIELTAEEARDCVAYANLYIDPDYPDLDSLEIREDDNDSQFFDIFEIS